MLTNVINNFDVDFIVPISKVDENMERAHSVDGILTEKFWVKTKGAVKGYENHLQETDYLVSNMESREEEQEMLEELTMEQILSGSDNFEGLISLFNKYMEINEWTNMQKEEINGFMTFLLFRAQGKIPTGARMMRDFVQNH